MILNELLTILKRTDIFPEA